MRKGRRSIYASDLYMTVPTGWPSLAIFALLEALVLDTTRAVSLEHFSILVLEFELGIFPCITLYHTSGAERYCDVLIRVEIVLSLQRRFWR